LRLSILDWAKTLARRCPTPTTRLLDSSSSCELTESPRPESRRSSARRHRPGPLQCHDPRRNRGDGRPVTVALPFSPAALPRLHSPQRFSSAYVSISREIRRVRNPLRSGNRRWRLRIPRTQRRLCPKRRSCRGRSQVGLAMRSRQRQERRAASCGLRSQEPRVTGWSSFEDRHSSSRPTPHRRGSRFRRAGPSPDPARVSRPAITAGTSGRCLRVAGVRRPWSRRSSSYRLADPA
jgi:hypothetical protein